jgi:hypothetical protein
MKPPPKIETARLRRRALHPNISATPRGFRCYARVKEAS